MYHAAYCFLLLCFSFESEELPAYWHSGPQLRSFRTTAQQIIPIPQAPNLKTWMEGKTELFLSTIQSRVRRKSTKHQKTRVKPRPFKPSLREHAVLQQSFVGGTGEHRKIFCYSLTAGCLIFNDRKDPPYLCWNSIACTKPGIQISLTRQHLPIRWKEKDVTH